MPDVPDWKALIPHRGAMSLLDSVLDWDATRLAARSTSHARADNPLRDAAGRLHAVQLAEWGAQAAAVHGALLARAAGHAAPRPGRLVSLREVVLGAAFVTDPAPLDVEASCLYRDAGGAQYAFRVAQGGHLLAAGRVAVIHPGTTAPGA